ncbi:MAG: PorP/SprF family type IX secretion system membrane protein [Flavobacteriales bacterium]|nr:PorP/SprF family type IX secretion system membrane protein [Flavobacteriales bacterium]
MKNFSLTHEGFKLRATSHKLLRVAGKLVACGLWLAALPDTLSAQDVHFSQFFTAPLVLNPANAGDIEGDQRAALMHRSQWQSAGSPFRTYAMSYDVPLFRRRMRGRYLGVGVHGFSDRAGSTRFGDTQGSLSISYALRSGDRSLLAFGLQGGYGQRSAVLNGMRWDSQYNGAGYDENLPTGETMASSTSGFVDLGAGFLWRGETKGGMQWRSGIAVMHLNEPSVSLFGSSEDRLFRRYTAHAELRITGDRWTWMPKVYISQQGSSREIIFGTLMHRRIGQDSRYTTDKTSNAFHIGCFYRWNDAVVPMAQFEYKRKLAIGLSYDLNVSKLRAATHMRGGAELSLQWIGAFSDKRRVLPNGKSF